MIDVLVDHPGGHRPGHVVAGQELVDELVAVPVPQQRPVTPEGLGEQRPWHLRVVQGRGVELDELEIGQHRPRPPGHRDPVAGGLGGVGGHGVDLTGTTRGQQRVPGPDRQPRPVRAQGVHPPAPAALHHEVEGEGVLVDLRRGRPRRGHQGPLDLHARRGPAGMDDAGLGVPALAGQRQVPSGVPIEHGTEGDQLVDPPRPLVDQHPHGGRVTQVGTGFQGVGDVQVEGVGVLVEHRGHPALGPPGGRLVEHALG